MIQTSAVRIRPGSDFSFYKTVSKRLGMRLLVPPKRFVTFVTKYIKLRVTDIGALFTVGVPPRANATLGISL